MASKYWIKLYHEVLDDPKMGRLPDRLWRRVIELFLIAGEEHRNGWLPSVSEIADKLGILTEEVFDNLATLKKVGIIYMDDDGDHKVVDFARTQSKSILTSKKVTSYHRYLRSSHWEQIRTSALQRAGFVCDLCGTTSDLEVHHLTYDNIGHELPEDLVVLCHDCHRKEHGYD